MVDWQRLIPGYWTQNYPTSLEWDAALNEAIDSGEVRLSSRHLARVGPYWVWVSNWPYAYGHLHEGPEFLPRVATRKRLRKALLTSAIAAAQGGTTL